MEFEKRTILITGASTGIGKAISQKLLKESCNLVLIARRDNLINDFINEVEGQLANVKVIKCDVSNKLDVENAYNLAVAEFDKIDIAILNSGVGFNVTPETFNSKYAEETMNVNFMSVIYWIEQLLPEMMKRKGGIIAPVSSLADNRGYSGSGFYCASKAALSIFTEGLTIDLKKYCIKVLTIKPGFVKTPMTDNNRFKMPFLMSAEKSADIIINGIKKEKNIIQFPLPTVLGSKLIGLLPSWFYRLIAKKKS